MTLKVKSNLFYILLPVLLVFVLSFVYVDLGYVQSNQNVASSDLSVRNIDVDSIGTLSYEEKIEDFLGQLDDYSTSVESQSIVFTGNLSVGLKDSGINFLSTSEDYTSLQLSGSLDTTNCNLSTQMELGLNDEETYTEELNSTLEFDEENNDVLIVLDNGEQLSLSEELESDNLNECFAITAGLAIYALTVLVLGAIAVYTVAVVAPSFTSSADNTWNRITNWWNSLFGPKTVDKSKTLTSSERVLRTSRPTGSIYKLAYVIGKGSLNISSVNLGYLQALALLNSIYVFDDELNQVLDTTLLNKINKINLSGLSEQVLVDIKALDEQRTNNKNCFIGVYTPTMLNASKLAYVLRVEGIDLSTSAETHNVNVGSGYYYHFHDPRHKIHIWFGNPI